VIFTETPDQADLHFEARILIDMEFGNKMVFLYSSMIV